MPTQLLESLDEYLRSSSYLGRGQRHGGAGRTARVARETGNAHHAFVEVVVGFQVPVADGPVVRSSGYSPHPEVRRVAPGQPSFVVDGAAAHSVVHAGLPDGLGVVVGVAVGEAVDSVRWRRRNELQVLVVRVGRGIVGGLDPVALFEADDPYSRDLTESPRESGAGSSAADYKDICGIFRNGHCLASNPIRRWPGALLLAGPHRFSAT